MRTRSSACTLAAVEMHHHQRHVGRRDAADPAGLRQADRAARDQLLARFGPQLRDRGDSRSCREFASPPAAAAARLPPPAARRSRRTSRRTRLARATSGATRGQLGQPRDHIGPSRFPAAAAAFSSESPSTRALRSSASTRSISASLCSNRCQRSSSTSPIRRPSGVSRRSALSCRSSRRYSARLVNMRYGSSTPRVTRSSISTPM